MGAKQEFGITEDLDPDDGAFWMCWQDFLNYFTTLTVCYCRRDWTDVRVPVILNYDHEQKQLRTNPVKLVVPPGGKAEWIGLFQQDMREQGAPQEYTDLTVLIFKECGNGKREPVGFVGCESARQCFAGFTPDDKDQDTNDPLEEGTYLLVPFTSGRHWDESSGNSRQIALSCHA